MELKLYLLKTRLGLNLDLSDVRIKREVESIPQDELLDALGLTLMDIPIETVSFDIPEVFVIENGKLRTSSLKSDRHVLLDDLTYIREDETISVFVILYKGPVDTSKLPFGIAKFYRQKLIGDLKKKD